MSQATMTEADWRAEGTRLFGADILKWRFKCPICGHAASPLDFKRFKAAGATPSSATNECIGRYYPATQRRGSFGEGAKVAQPCDYAGYGLFRLSPVLVKHADGTETHCFAFAEPAIQNEQARTAAEVAAS